MSSSPRHSSQSVPPEAWPPLARFFRIAGLPLQRFLQIEASSGILLLLAAAAALVCANSALAEGYFALWHTPVGFRIGELQFERSLEWVVNDGLMVIFFFVVGLEIRREIHCGELSEWRRAALPAIAALGGMVVPALLYLSFASARETHAGWGIPMATDIAFAVGVLALLGKRVPPALRVLLLALAVIDDLGSILVIALFYSEGVRWSGMLLALLGVALTYALQISGVRRKILYVPPGVVVWAGIYASGVHPTIAGVLLGLITPVTAWREKLSPAERLIEMLHPWVAYGIMPVFALANAGVTLSGVDLADAPLRVALGCAVGLIAGKPIGVLLACGLAIRSNIAALPAGIGARQLVVLGLVAGIGFTMSLFVAQLAFNDPALLAAAKLGVLAASTIAACAGLACGRAMLSTTRAPDAALTADEAEASTVR